MKRSAKTVYSLVALALLAVFTFTTCGSPFFERLPGGADSYVIEVGKGTPKFFFLDEDYNPITDIDPAVDPGRTVLYIEDNPLAESAMVVADSTGENNDVVRMLETAKGIKINFFFRKGGTISLGN